jgi:endothelin-converting enzyme/putative endopeptidase
MLIADFLRAALAFAFAVTLCDLGVAQNVYPQDMDRSVKAGDDFYRYANGGWIKSRGAGGQASDTRAVVAERTSQRVRELIQAAALAKAVKGSPEQKAGDYYASFMDAGGVEAKGMAPLAHEKSAIEAISDRKSLSRYLGGTLNSEVDGLTANADHVLGLWVNQGFEDSKHNLPHIWQGGIGLPDRDNYLDGSAKMEELRGSYRGHIAAIFRLAGVGDAETRAAGVMALETQIAQAFAPDADATDVSKQNNPWKRKDFDTKAPGMDWDAYFASAGLGTQQDFIVWQPSAVTGISALVAHGDIGRWKDYLVFHLVEHYAGVLPKAVGEEDFAFYGRKLTGAEQMPDRGERAIAATNAALGQAVGQLYTQRYFPAEAKAKAEEMGANLLTAYRVRIANLKWMSPETRSKAQAKLAAFKLELGYPDKWIDYSTLTIDRGDALGNLRRAEEFNRLRNVARLTEPVNPIDWPINPQIPGAIIMFSPNAEFFSAGILQAPYFDYQGDEASNYGSAGAGMAHEISHSFDDLGNIYDDEGRLAKWWSQDDEKRYQAEASKLEAEFDSYCPIAGVCVKGKQVMTESIADLVGLRIAHDAYVLSLKGKADVSIGGLSGEQRFFVAFAQRWRKIQSEDALRRQIQTDTHPPGEYRSDTVRNVEDWYKAFGVSAGDKLYLKPEDRAGIW